MPGSVSVAVIPTVSGHPLVFPFALCRAFTVQLSWPVRTNEYHDGSTQRQALVASDRRSWKLTQRLTGAQMAALYTFAKTYPTTAFYFYDMKDVSAGQLEGANYDATGSSLQGRYKAVISSGDLSISVSLGRPDVSIELREVA